MVIFADYLGLLRFVMNSRCTKGTAITSFQPPQCIDRLILHCFRQESNNQAKQVMRFQILKISSEILGIQDFQ